MESMKASVIFPATAAQVELSTPPNPSEVSPSRDNATPQTLDAQRLNALAGQIREWASELGFGRIGITDTDLSHAEAGLQQWLDDGCHGDMDYMAAHGMKRARPAELVPGTVRVISARMNYLPSDTDMASWRQREAARAAMPAEAIVSVYARGRDYHKVVRNRLQQLADRITQAIGPFGYRAFTDSAPVLEVELAQKAGLGWRGKHTLLLSRDAGSLFFLGEIFVDVPLPVDVDTDTDTDAAPGDEARGMQRGEHCGQCERCREVCPTGAITEAFRVDARLCISYLTIEHKGAIPEALRAKMGNRIYGCDDCQLYCPWNKFAQPSPLTDFAPRNRLDCASLIELFAWSEADFMDKLAGSPIRRIGHERWLRNLAVGLGNALRDTGDANARKPLRDALLARRAHPSALVREHVEWALAQEGAAV
ncbi:tRNA epoxyqueuosine(34) reductase QueG [Pandoraea fibrosis]|uniref:Epoxyqueuosine reductase n=1 Tax=Pandoraea fibrosis TaxID=1891094 RepID=A0ABX6HP78_9BURK|nr:tRNA epoxyqueuosine(34) reductase QueG [Pandoraea fibrosis]QHE93759.1 tRNA epoxyqueuosine(34) reductase QueG [Pandoraea fibrosis]QHF12679.1 tRNA epoxyqueuosine(34) reductase QueG [Pandoraea fibrosis]